MAGATALYRLEQLDTELERQAAQLAQMQRNQGRNPELEAIEARLENLRSQERQVSAEQRTLESDLADLESKIKRDQTRLYSGQIVDSRELASLEKELDHYRSQRDTLEERVLLAMEQLEGLQEAVATTSRQTSEMRRHAEEDRPQLIRQAEQLAEALAAMRDERDALAGSIDAPLLSLYQRLRSSSGHAVSAVSNGVCQWCRVVIPPKDVQHARSDTLVTCTNCARILYIGS